MATIESRIKHLRKAARLWAVGTVMIIFLMIHPLVRSFFSRNFIIFFFAGNIYVLGFLYGSFGA